MISDITEECAIYVSHAYKAYASKQILNNFSMTVPRGCIYGLLGSSGCGKTTLLRCVLGRKEVSSGDIYVLGVKTGSQARVQGCRVGYMPQDTSLVAEFTIKDTIFFFGRILNMEDDVVLKRFEMLKKLLDIPPDNRKVKNCSGGQQRRISLAVALIHNPELLILDEPTVGLDPVLRASIWGYLKRVAEEGTAVIITTHYIEEAKQAHKIGIMRGGELMAEASPDRLLQLFNTDKLEDVFLRLSSQQEQGQLENVVEGCGLETRSDDVNSSVVAKHLRLTVTDVIRLKKRRLRALFVKNIKQLIGNPNGIVIAFILPILTMCSFLTAFGGDPKSIPIAVVNDELPNDCSTYKETSTISYSSASCKFTNLSCRFLDELQDPMIHLLPYNNVDYAINEVRHGNAVGVIYIPQNFSESFTNRMNYGLHSSSSDIDFGKIDFWLDMSNIHISEPVRNRILNLSQKCLVTAFKECNYLEKFGRAPLRFHYEGGVQGASFVDFALPGVLLSMIFLLGASLTCALIIIDRLEGIWDRTIVAGVTSLEILFSHFITEIFLVLVQTSEIVVLTFAIFRMHYFGNMWLIYLLIFMQGICGMSFGIFTSILSDSFLMANSLISAVFVPLIVASGIIWPLEVQAYALQYFSICLPFTKSTTSLRAVLKKGAGIGNLVTIEGLSVVFTWTCIFAIISILIVKLKR